MSYAVHARNAAAMWSALAEGDGEVLLRSERAQVIEPSPYHTLRAIVLDAVSEPERTVGEVVDAVLSRTNARRKVVEDAGGILDFAPRGFEERFRFSVMAREPGSGAGRVVRDAFTAGAAVADLERLAAAERIMFAVFPPARLEPTMRGLIQPPRVLGIKGWCVWLAHRSGVPAGAAYTFHDGTSVGVYQVATLPEHRGNGVARALMASILDRYQDVPITLTATDQGRPLYEQLGFHTVDTAIWWVPGPTADPTGDDTGGPLR
jgi:GNAT superfamily N-acetyltransferase